MAYIIEQITAQHDEKICSIIELVGREYGAIGDGFGPSDSEVKAMSKHYNDEQGSRYFIAVVDGIVVGGSGIAAFDSKGKVCELRKLFLTPQSRGLGLGKLLVDECLAYAEQKGYQQCYLDTLANMHAAIALYQKMGFEHLQAPLTGTIHNGCDVWMLKTL